MTITYEVHTLRTQSGGFENYCYIVTDTATRTALIVDPSWELSKITARLEQLGVSLTAILLTHSHFDHVNLVDPLLQLFKPSIYMSRREMEECSFRCKDMIPLQDEDEVVLGKTVIRCMLTPGHSPGGMCFLLPDSIFTGDTVFAEGVGICDSREGACLQLYYSVQKIKRTVSPTTRVYPGHSYGKPPGQTIDSLLSENIYFQFDNPDAFIKFRTRKHQKGIIHFR